MKEYEMENMKKYEETMKEYDGTCGKYKGISPTI